MMRCWVERWLSGEHFREIQNQGDFALCPLGIAYSVLLDRHCTLSTLTPIKVDSELKSREA